MFNMNCSIDHSAAFARTQHTLCVRRMHATTHTHTRAHAHAYGAALYWCILQHSSLSFLHYLLITETETKTKRRKNNTPTTAHVLMALFLCGCYLPMEALLPLSVCMCA